MNAIRNLLLLLGLFLVPVSLLSQNLFSETPVNDSIIQLTAEARGLEPIAPEDLPPFGTFWVVGSNGFAAPYPCLPNAVFPVYRMADGQYLVDGTDGQVSA